MWARVCLILITIKRSSSSFSTEKLFLFGIFISKKKKKINQDEIGNLIIFSSSVSRFGKLDTRGSEFIYWHFRTIRSYVAQCSLCSLHSSDKGQVIRNAHSLLFIIFRLSNNNNAGQEFCAVVICEAATKEQFPNSEIDFDKCEWFSLAIWINLIVIGHTRFFCLFSVSSLVVGWVFVLADDVLMKSAKEIIESFRVCEYVWAVRQEQMCVYIKRIVNCCCANRIKVALFWIMLSCVSVESHSIYSSTIFAAYVTNPKHKTNINTLKPLNIFFDFAQQMKHFIFANAYKNVVLH